MNNILGLECSGTLAQIPFYVQIGIYVISGLLIFAGLLVIPTVLKRSCCCTCGYGLLIFILFFVTAALSIVMAAAYLVRPSHVD
jgi:hypothetical protein